MTNRPTGNNMEKYTQVTYEQRYLISLMINETQIKTTKPLFKYSVARFRRL